MSKCAGIVLAGGMSSRFGESKALVGRKESTFIEHIVQVMESILQDVVVISHTDIKERVEQLVQVPVIEDMSHYKGNGPLLWNSVRNGIHRFRLVYYHAL